MRRAWVAVLALTVVGCTSSGGGSARTSSSAPASRIAPSSVAPPGSTQHSVDAPRTAVVLGSGDVLIHPALWQQAHRDAGGHGYDFGPMYASIAPDVRVADVATCEMETPLARPTGPFIGWPDFNAPPQVLTALRHVGYNTCTTASNHTLDQGYDGVRRTLDELDAAGLRHTGAARTAAEAAQTLIVTTKQGVKIAQLAYAFGFNGNQLPAGKPWLANLIDVPRILADAQRARERGADIVVVSLHWGTEYDHLATPEQLDQAHALLKSKYVDLILGDHAHVVQPAQKIDGKWVFYCMGNQISRHADPIPESRQGIMPRVTFTEVSPHHFVTIKAEAIATWMQDTPTLRLIDVHRALADPSISAAQARELRTAQTAIRGYLNAYGALREGLIIR